MSVYETNRQVPLGSVATLRLVNLLEHGYDAFTSWNARRVTEAQLSKLSDAQLSDIGLRRANIATVADQLSRG